MVRYLCRYGLVGGLLLCLLAGGGCVGFPHCFQNDECAPNEICWQGLCTAATDRDCDGVLDPPSAEVITTSACYTGPHGCQQTKNATPGAWQCTGGCRAGTRHCREGKWSLCQEEVLPQLEVCNGQDDDCDGDIDETDPQLGKTCTVEGQKGLCREGQWQCTRGRLICHASTRRQPVEACNGIDDNCDGQVDEGCCVLPFRRVRVFPHDAYHLAPVISVRYSPDGKWIASGDAHGLVKLWDASTHKYVRTLRSHSFGITEIAYHPDPTKGILVSASEDASLVFWKMPEGRRIYQLAAHPQSVNSIAFHPQGTMFATGAKDNIVRIWSWDDNPQAIKLHMTLKGHSSPLRSVRFHPDGKRLLSASDDGTIRIWGLDDGKEKHQWKVVDQAGAAVRIAKIAIHADGTRVAAALYDKTVRIWSITAPGAAPMVLQEHRAVVRSVAWIPDRDQLVSVCDSAGSSEISLWIWDTNKGTLLSTHNDKGSPSGYDLDFAPEKGGSSLVVASSTHKSIQWWDWNTWTWQARQQKTGDTRHTGRIKAMVLQEGDAPKLITGAEDDTIRIWSLADGTQSVSTLRGHSGWVEALAIHPKHTILASGSRDLSIHLWDISSTSQPTARTLESKQAHTQYPTSLAFSADGQWLVSSAADKSVRIWDTSTATHSKTLTLPERSAIFASFFNQDKEILAVTSHGYAVLWEIASGKQLATHQLFPKTPSGSIKASAATLSQDQERLMIGTEVGQIQLISTRTWLVDKSLNNPRADKITRLAIAPTGDFLAVALERGWISLWDLKTGNHAHDIFGHSRGTWALLFAPNGRQLYSTGGDEQIIEWSCQSTPQPQNSP